MPTDNDQKEVVLYFGEQRIGVLSEFESIPTIEPKTELRLGETPPDFQFTATLWKSCRTRKRFIKLVMGVFGLPRNNASALADIAIKSGCPSYQDLWADCFTYFIKETLEYMATHDKPDNPARGSE